MNNYTDVPGDSRFKELIIDKPSESLLALAAQYDSIIESAAAKAAIQPNLVRAVIAVGSGFDAAAVSKQGKAGLMQLTPEKAKRYGVTNIYDPGENINAGTRYLSDLIRRFDNNLPVALAAYNAGEDAVERYGGRIPPFSETLAYVPAVLKIYNQLLPPTTVALHKDRLQAESIPLSSRSDPNERSADSSTTYWPVLTKRPSDAVILRRVNENRSAACCVCWSRTG